MIHPRRTLTVLMAALAIGTSGCSSSPPSSLPPVSATAPAANPSVDYREPRQVCDAFAVAVYRVDTTVDRGPQDAYRRATAYVDAELAAAVAAAPAAPLTPLWQQWTAHGVYVDVQTAKYAGDALPSATDGEQHHATVVTTRPVGRDGWHGPAQRRTVVCTLRQGGAGWRVSAYETG